MTKRPIRRSLALWLAILITFALGAAACGDDDESSEPPSTIAAPDDAGDDASDDTDMDEDVTPEPVELQTIRLVPWGGRFIDFIDLYVGEENGYFAEAGVKIEQLPGAGAGDAVRQLVAGNADIAMADPFSGFFAVIAGEDLEGFYCPYTKNWLTMVVNEGGGISEPEDLRGKTIAVTSQASTSKWYAALLLAANGITEDDVTFAATGIDFFSALESGEAQAASTWGSINWALFGENGLTGPDDYAIWEYEQVPGPNDVYFAKAGWVEENSELLGGFIDALEKSKNWIAENPDAAAQIGSEYADGADNLVRNRAVIDFRIDMQNTGPGVAENGMGWCDVDTIADLAAQGLSLGIIESEVDVASIFSNRYAGN